MWVSRNSYLLSSMVIILLFSSLSKLTGQIDLVKIAKETEQTNNAENKTGCRYLYHYNYHCRKKLSCISSASGTETMAVPQSDGSYKLHGFKWFTSATDADVTLTLARVQDRRGATTPVQQFS